MKLTRTVHVQHAFRVAPMRELAPDVELAAQNAAGDIERAELHGVAFTDPDGDVQIFVLDDAGRSSLIEQLTGGVVIPR